MLLCLICYKDIKRKYIMNCRNEKCKKNICQTCFKKLDIICPYCTKIMKYIQCYCKKIHYNAYKYDGFCSNRCKIKFSLK